MKKRSVQSLFIGVMIFLPVHYAMVGLAGELHSEPWPAFVMPGFKNVYVSEDGLFQIRQKRFLIYVNSTSEPSELLPQELFPELPLSQVPGFMRTHFSGRARLEQLSEEARVFLYRQAHKVLGSEPVMIELFIQIENYQTMDGKLILQSVYKTDQVSIPMQTGE